jgi:hypothetical protein
MLGRAAGNSMSVDMVSVSTEFDIFNKKPLQEAVLETVEVTYKSIGIIDHTDLEFNIPADDETYIDTNLHIFVSGKLTTADGKHLTAK